MSEFSERLRHRHGESAINAISAGCFFILIGAIFATTPTIVDGVSAFFRDFDILKVPHTEIYLPAPKSPSTHTIVYSAALQFSLVWGIFQIAVLLLRFFMHSKLSKKAETASNIVYWFGSYYLIMTFLNETTTLTTWFAYWAAIIILLGITLIVRAFILAVWRQMSSDLRPLHGSKRAS